jgi:hypothetical protein
MDIRGRVAVEAFPWKGIIVLNNTGPGFRETESLQDKLVDSEKK